VDQYVTRLIALRDELRHAAFIFCKLIAANEKAIESDHVAKVRDLIEAAINTIDETPI
jgi:hypothetical protein